MLENSLPGDLVVCTFADKFGKLQAGQVYEVLRVCWRNGPQLRLVEFGDNEIFELSHFKVYKEYPCYG